jgi:hypothetical protein
MHGRLQPSELGLIGACFFMTQLGKRSLICCDARERSAVITAARIKERRTNPAAFIDHLVKRLCNSSSHKTEGGPYTIYQQGVVGLEAILHNFRTKKPYRVDKSCWVSPGQAKFMYEELLQEVLLILPDITCFHSGTKLIPLSRSGAQMLVFDVQNPGFPLDREDVPNALAVSSQAMNLFLGDFSPRERDVLWNEYNGHSSYLKDQIKVYGVVDDQALTTDDDTDEEETDEEGPDDEDSDEENSDDEEVPSASLRFYVDGCDLTEDRIKQMLHSMQARQCTTTRKHDNPSEYRRFHESRNGGRIIINDFRSCEHLTNFIKEHGSKCAVSNSTKRLCVDRTTDDKDHSDKEGHCHLVTQEINRMKSCYSIFFNQKSLDKFRELNKIDTSLDNSEVVGMVLRPMLLSFVNHRKEMGKYTEDEWFCVGNRE